MKEEKKFRFCRFDVYWIQTNKHTDRQAKFIYRLLIKSFFQAEPDKIIRFLEFKTTLIK